MDRTITIAQPKDADIVYEITQVTINTVYPKESILSVDIPRSNIT